MKNLFPPHFQSDEIEVAFRRQYARTGHRQSVIGLSIGLVLALVAITLSIILDHQNDNPRAELILFTIRSVIAIILGIGLINLPQQEKAEPDDYYRWVVRPAALAILALVLNYWVAAYYAETPPPAARIFLVSSLALWLFCAFARPSSQLAAVIASISSIGAIAAGYISEASGILDTVAYLLIANFSAMSVTIQSEKRARTLYQRTLELEESQRQLSEKSERAIRSRDFKSRVLTTVSHDLRQPLLGADLVLSNQLISKSGPDLAKLRLVSNALRQIQAGLEEILRAAVADEVDPESSVEPIELSAIVVQALTDIQPIAHQAGIEVHWRNHLPPSTRVSTSPAVVRTALLNLLGNALKFQRRVSNPWVLVRCFVAPSRQNSVYLEVIDNGPGVDPESATEIFTTGYRLPRDSDVPGFGIGLASVAEQVRELPHHDVMLVRRYRRGARFRLTLPVASSITRLRDIGA
ncbi:MAG: HAMP domain-containing histidine kinase [Burkholderiaceae bacterium]|jgi:signal transduction histidine kinase|nr:HAMP domain-containing histidine kinase [Burkholderiaceae bacterium]